MSVLKSYSASLIAAHMSNLSPEAQAFLCKALDTFAGSMAKESTEKSAKIAFVGIKQQDGSRVTGSQRRATVITDYGTSPLGLQLASLEAAARITALSGAPVTVGLVPGVRLEKATDKPDKK